MQITKHEVANNSPEQVKDYLRDAISLADELTEGGAEWVAVFTKSVDLLSGKQIIMEQTPTLPLGNILGNGRR